MRESMHVCGQAGRHINTYVIVDGRFPAYAREHVFTFVLVKICMPNLQVHFCAHMHAFMLFHS